MPHDTACNIKILGNTQQKLRIIQGCGYLFLAC